MFPLTFMWIFIFPSSFLMAILLYDWYRHKTLQYRADVALICNLAKFPYKDKNQELCIALMDKYGVSPNTLSSASSDYQSTPYLSACFGGSLELIQFMLENGADNAFRNPDGDSPLYMAIHGIAWRLRSVKSNTQDRSIEIQLGVLIIDCLISSGCDINTQNKYGFTPLHWAATTGEKWLVHHLLRRGADPTTRTVFSGAPPSAFALCKTQSFCDDLINNNV